MDNRKLVNISEEVRHYYRSIFLTLGSFLAFNLISRRLYDNVSNTFISIVVILIILPFLCFYIYRIVKIKTDINDYIFQEAVYANGHINYFVKRMYFDVEVKDNEGRTRIVSTRCIFSTYLLGFPSYGKYNNTVCLVGFNCKTKELVTIKVIRPM